MFGPPVSKTDSYDCRETTVTTEVVDIQIRESGETRKIMAQGYCKNCRA